MATVINSQAGATIAVAHNDGSTQVDVYQVAPNETITITPNGTTSVALNTSPSDAVQQVAGILIQSGS